MTVCDMFGNEVDLDALMNAPLTISGRKKRKPTRPRGHAWAPGTGPAGETCKTCKHYTLVQGGAGTFRKCGKNQSAWTRGPGSDIRAKDLACKFWEKSDD